MVTKNIYLVFGVSKLFFGKQEKVTEPTDEQPLLLISVF